MSDDLISRKELFKEIQSFRCSITGLRAGKGVLAHAADEYRKSILQIVENQPVAFDEEKVIEKLTELRKKEYNDEEEDDELLDGEEIYDAGRLQGRFEAYHKAIEIVEKGGV